jgi:hypothetical protein
MLFLACFPRGTQFSLRFITPMGWMESTVSGYGRMGVDRVEERLPGGRFSSLLALPQLQSVDWNVMRSSIIVPLNWSRTDLQTEC